MCKQTTFLGGRNCRYLKCEFWPVLNIEQGAACLLVFVLLMLAPGRSGGRDGAPPELITSIPAVIDTQEAARRNIC